MGARAQDRCVIGNAMFDWLPATLLDHADAYCDRQAWVDDRTRHDASLDARWRHWQELLVDLEDRGNRGVCTLCGARRFAAGTRNREGAIDPREGLVCEGCRLNARTRIALDWFSTLCPDRAAPIYLCEQATPAYVWMRKRYPKLIGSEFCREPLRRARLGFWLARHRGGWWPRHEDLLRLSMRDASQRAVVSFDVLEHVSDCNAALRECARVTLADGLLLVTVPFRTDLTETRMRAQHATDGEIEHLHMPEYHGDPLGKPILSYRDFGWDLLDAIRAAGYRDAAVLISRGDEAALLPPELNVVVARR
jgi:SAM-dependent methyltransferase